MIPLFQSHKPPSLSYIHLCCLKDASVYSCPEHMIMCISRDFAMIMLFHNICFTLGSIYHKFIFIWLFRKNKVNVKIFKNTIIKLGSILSINGNFSIHERSNVWFYFRLYGIFDKFFFFQLCGQLLWLNIFQEENGDYNFEYDVL